MRRDSRALSAFLLVAALCGSAPARANGAFPFVSQLVSNPSHPEELVLRGNFGLVVSRDAGKSWDWLCEAGMLYQNVEPPIALLDSGVLLLALPTGISRSDESWCTFETVANASANFVDVSAEHAKPGAAVALSTDLSKSTSQVWESLDDGKTFVPLGPALTDFIATTIDVAASDDQLIYVSGNSADGQGLLLRSADHGKSFEPHQLPSRLLISTAPYISALDPKSLDTVYLRSDSAPGTLMVTRNGGADFQEMLRLSAPIKAFALSPDGSSVLAATVGSGIYQIDTATLEPHKIACTGVWCFSWTKDNVYACGDIVANGYLVASSSDAGHSFAPLVTPTCVRGPLACDDATSVGSSCPGAWPAQRSTLGPNECITSVPEPNQDCLAQAGSNAAAGAPSSAGAPESETQAGDGAGGAIGGAPTPPAGGQAGTAIVPPAPMPHASGGCSLGALVSSPRGLGGTTLALLMLGVRARRRRAKLEG